MALVWWANKQVEQIAVLFGSLNELLSYWAATPALTFSQDLAGQRGIPEQSIGLVPNSMQEAWQLQ